MSPLSFGVQDIESNHIPMCEASLSQAVEGLTAAALAIFERG